MAGAEAGHSQLVLIRAVVDPGVRQRHGAELEAAVQQPLARQELWREQKGRRGGGRKGGSGPRETACRHMNMGWLGPGYCLLQQPQCLLAAYLLYNLW